MSSLQPLLRFIDSVQFRNQQEERRRQREAIPPDFEPDPIGELPPLGDARPTPMRCRICRTEGLDRFCLKCLAETMEPAPPADD